MSEFGSFLTALFDSKSTFQTVQAVVRHWLNLDDAPIPYNREGIDGEASSDQPRTLEEVLVVNIEMSSRARIDKYNHIDGIYKIESTTLRNRDVTLNYIYNDSIDSGDSVAEIETIGSGFLVSDCNFSRDQIRQFAQILSLEPLGTVEVVGRTCAKILATPRPEFPVWPHWLPFGADEYELHADTGYAVLLSIIARYRGRIFDIREVTNISFDKLLDFRLFDNIYDSSGIPGRYQDFDRRPQ